MALNTHSALLTHSSQNYLSVANNLGIDGTSITMAGWFYLNSNPGAGTNFGMFCCMSVGTHVKYSAQYFENSGNYIIRFKRSRCNVNGTTIDTSNINWSLNAWHHVALAYNGTNLTCYIDGSVVGGPTAASGVGTTSASGFSIGAVDESETSTFTPTATRTWDGLIDDVRVYSTDIGSVAIGLLFTAPDNVSGSETNLVDGYNFNPDLTTDVGSGAHNLTNTGTVTQSNTVPFPGSGGGGTTLPFKALLGVGI